MKKALTAISVAMILSGCMQKKQQLKAEQMNELLKVGDLWEKKYGAHALKPTVNLAYGKYQPSGDIYEDFAKFMQLQGGGKSLDPHDPAAGNYPPQPHSDGIYYHTVHDITWGFFCTWSSKVGIQQTSSNFYNMTDEDHTKMVHAFIKDGLNLFKIKSDIVATVYLYASWGSGIGDGIHGNGRFDFGSRDLMDYYEKMYGMTVNESIDVIGEYLTFFYSISLRREQMKRDTNGYSRYGINWSSGLAHFHRVFKTYCKS